LKAAQAQEFQDSMLWLGSALDSARKIAAAMRVKHIESQDFLERAKKETKIAAEIVRPPSGAF